MCTLFSITLIFLSQTVFPQSKKKITLEDIWLKNTFQVNTFQDYKWMKSGKTYSKLVQDPKTGGFSIHIYEVLSDKKVKTILPEKALKETSLTVDEYQFSTDETKLLLQTETEPIYRYSTKARFTVFDAIKKKFTTLSSGHPIMYATFAPDGNKVAYVKDNNLYYTDLQTNKEIQITSDGFKNQIINGAADWVYEEEFELLQTFFWSPDSKKIAYISFNESQVKEYSFEIYDSLYPSIYKYKYPKAGEKNAEVKVSIFNTSDSTAKTIYDGKGKDLYIPRIQWTSNSEILSIQKLNRNQDTLQIINATLSPTQLKTIKTFTSNAYIEINDNLFYLKSGTEWIYTAETDGFRHIYLFDINGNQIKQITKGAWEVTQIVGIDENKNIVYYSSKEYSPLEQHIYSININTLEKKKLSELPGTNHASFDPTFTYWINENASINGSTTTLLKTASPTPIKVVEENKNLKLKLESEYETGIFNFMSFKNRDSTDLNAWIIKPVNFDSMKKYPLLIFTYGGPGHQTVTNDWKGKNLLWFYALAQKGFIVASVDNRGTTGRGAAFRNSTTRQLGKLESEDQADFVKHLIKKGNIDKDKVAIFGWSYGGYLASLCLLLEPDVFSSAIAVAPVTSWRFYDSIYAERYLKSPKDNAKGYDAFSPINHASRLKGKYLLIHGTADDNVHFQNAIEMQKALIQAGKQFRSFYYPDKNHGIGGTSTRYHLYDMMTRFLLENAATE